MDVQTSGSKCQCAVHVGQYSRCCQQSARLQTANCQLECGRHVLHPVDALQTNTMTPQLLHCLIFRLAPEMSNAYEEANCQPDGVFAVPGLCVRCGWCCLSGYSVRIIGPIFSDEASTGRPETSVKQLPTYAAHHAGKVKTVTVPRRKPGNSQDFS